MKQLKVICVVLVSVLMFGCSGGGADQHAQQRAQLEATLKQAQDQYGLTAIVYGVWQGDQEIMVGGIGDSAPGVKAAADMSLRAGGVTEMMQTTLLMKLIEDGRYGISLDDPISTWFPEDFPYAQQVTLRMLANSTTGYFDFLNSKAITEDPEFNTKNWDPMDLIYAGVLEPNLFEPGTRFTYSHTNYCILGVALERITKQSLAQLIEEHIAQPLALSRTQYTSSPLPNPALQAYVVTNGEFQNSTLWNPSWAGPSGLVMSNALELGAWTRAFGRGDLVSPESFATIMHGIPTHLPNVEFGMAIIQSASWAYQNPSINGYKTIVAYHAPSDITLVLTTTDGPRGDTNTHYALLMFPEIAKILVPNNAPVGIPPTGQ